MNQNQSKTLWISVGAGLFAMLLIYSYSQDKQAELNKRFGASKRVVVAKEDILEMQTIDDTKIDIVEIPNEFVQPNPIEAPEDAVGQVAAAPIKKGEQILANKLLSPGPNTGLALQVAPGRRAITIPVDDVRGVAKLIRPGDRVDLLTAIESGAGPNRKSEVKTLIQDITVLATGINVTNNLPRKLELDGSGRASSYKNLRGDLSFSTVTLEASPQQAQDLISIMATSPGSIYLTLRHPTDRAPVNNLRVSNSDAILSSDRSMASQPGTR